jgi:hypothetical protein
LRTLIVIMTDGQENSSVEYDRARMREIIARCQSQHGFEFIFLGANQDAFAEASGYGMATNHRGGRCNKLRANRQLIVYFFPPAHRLVFVAHDRQFIV